MPSNAATRAGRSVSRAGSGPGPPTSIVPGASVAPTTCSMRIEAITWASSAASGDRPFSNRDEASLRTPSLREVRWMLGPFQLATSMSTRVVASETSEREPPMIPASEVGPSSSRMTTIGGSSSRTAPSSSSMRSPVCAGRTTSRCPATRSRSNACSGWPVSSITKFVMSTTLLIGRWPAAISRAFSHGGEGPMRTSSYARAVKRGHSSSSSTTTSAPCTGPGEPGSALHGGVASGAPVMAWTSLARP